LFGFKFVCLATLAAVLDAFVVPNWWRLQATTVALVAHSVPVFGLSATTFGSSIAFADPEGMGFAYLVTPGCTAALPVFLYMAAVFAYPAAWKQRVYGLLYGVAFLLALNVLRLSSMAWIGMRFPDFFEEAHLSWWQASFIIAVAFTWWFWVQSLDPAKDRLRRRLPAFFSQLGLVSK